MLRLMPFVALLTSSLLVLSCASDTVVQTGKIDVRVDESVDFTQFQTFSVVTQDQVDPDQLPDDLPELGDQQEAFNNEVNQMIIDAMRAEPVCLEYIPPDQVQQGQPDHVWAANGLAQSTDGGYVYQCCGGWWWGYWGWYWNPCATWCPIYVEYDVGTLFVPVGLPPVEDEDPAAVFAGLAYAVSAAVADEDDVRAAVRAIFQFWPDPRTCPAQTP